jgi:hypothetical protein
MVRSKSDHEGKVRALPVHAESSISKLANGVSKSLGCARPFAPTGPKSGSSQWLPNILLMSRELVHQAERL